MISVEDYVVSEMNAIEMPRHHEQRFGGRAQGDTSRPVPTPSGLE